MRCGGQERDRVVLTTVKAARGGGAYPQGDGEVREQVSRGRWWKDRRLEQRHGGVTSRPHT